MLETKLLFSYCTNSGEKKDAILLTLLPPLTLNKSISQVIVCTVEGKTGSFCDFSPLEPL